jgi:hypothetical protein
VFPPYADRVAFIAADIDPSDTVDMVRAYEQSKGFSWTYALAPRQTLEKLNVTETDTKYLVRRDGVIVYAAGWGRHDAATWRAALEELTT